jgi:hypothetical protein
LRFGAAFAFGFARALGRVLRLTGFALADAARLRLGAAGFRDFALRVAFPLALRALAVLAAVLLFFVLLAMIPAFRFGSAIRVPAAF